MGVVWFGAWLFTIGFLRLTFWKGRARGCVVAVLSWPDVRFDATVIKRQRQTAAITRLRLAVTTP